MIKSDVTGDVIRPQSNRKEVIGREDSNQQGCGRKEQNIMDSNEKVKEGRAYEKILKEGMVDIVETVDQSKEKRHVVEKSKEYEQAMEIEENSENISLEGTTEVRNVKQSKRFRRLGERTRDPLREIHPAESNSWAQGKRKWENYEDSELRKCQDESNSKK